MMNHRTNITAVRPRVHFPGLDSLRFYAALAVLIEHVNAQVHVNNYLYKILTGFFVNGQSAVNLFFVLSGFLITYLLLDEWIITGKVNLRNFYSRRVLRILPLYYWIVLLGLFIFPILFGSNYPLTGLPGYRVIMTLALMPHFAGLTAPLVHLWSIGVEEQFYAFWPWASRSDTMILRVSLSVIVIKLLLTIIVKLLNDSNAASILFTLRFDSMAIGALGAYVYRKNHFLLKWIYKPVVQFVALGGFAYLAVSHIELNPYSSMLSAVAHIILILNIGTNPHPILKLNLPLLEKLGQFSYGFYMYHFPVLYLVRFTAVKIGLESVRTSPFLLLLSALASTLVISFISYRWLESPFLRLKNKLTPTSTDTNQVECTKLVIQ